MTEQESEKRRESRFNELIAKPATLTDEEIQELREVISKCSANMVRDHVLNRAQLRLTIDLIDSLRKFDHSSANQVGTTNTLTRSIRVLTWVMVLVGVLNVLASGWTNLVYWWKHF
jgi:hypothetical protein